MPRRQTFGYSRSASAPSRETCCFLVVKKNMQNGIKCLNEVCGTSGAVLIAVLFDDDVFPGGELGDCCLVPRIFPLHPIPLFPFAGWSW